ncbi:SDR family oxidoreductase [Arthrobacter sp. Z4-13]
METPAWGDLGALEGHDPSTVIDLDSMAAATVALGFKGVPDDIAQAVLFLASEQSRYVTGTDVIVDGGQLLM